MNNITVFVSTSPEAVNSLECIKFIKLNNIPVNIVRLDSKESRARVSKIIKEVPAMIIENGNGNISLYVGLPKIQKLLSSFIPRRVEREEVPVISSPPPNKTKKPRKKKPKKKIKKVELEFVREPPKEEENNYKPKPSDKQLTVMEKAMEKAKLMMQQRNDTFPEDFGKTKNF